MSDQSNPALAYRNTIRNNFRSFVPLSDSNWEQEFETWLNHFYEKSRNNLEKPTPSVVDPNDMAGARITIFVSAIGLLTYGHLNLIWSILDNIPSSPRNIRRLAWALRVMLPLPEDLDPLQDIEAVKEWVSRNESRLGWNEAEGKYVVRE